MPDASVIERHLRRSIKSLGISVSLHGDYYIIDAVMTVRDTKRNIVLSTAPLFFYNMMIGKALKPLNMVRLRNIIVVHKVYGSVEALGVLYARKNKTRLLVTGRPEAVNIIITRENPNSVSLPYNPFIYNITPCRGKTVYMYKPTRLTESYVCIYNP